MAEPKAPDLTGRQRMTWAQAVEAMRGGAYVRRASDMYLKRVYLDGEDESDTPIYESGQEGCYLAHAWTADEKPAQVFMGAPSKVLFVPDDEHRSATDWVVVEKTEC